MIICSNCGRMVLEKMNFCPFCGKETSEDIESPNYDKTDRNMRKLKRNGDYGELIYYAGKGNSLAEYFLVQYMIEAQKEQGPDKIPEYAKIFQLSKKEDPMAMAVIGIMDFTSYEYWSTSSNFLKGVELIKHAADENDPAAQTFIAKTHWGVEKKHWNDPKTYFKINDFAAYKYMQKASNLLYPEAMYCLGESFYYGKHGVVENKSEGFQLIEHAACCEEERAVRFMEKQNPNWEEKNPLKLINDELIKAANKLLV